MALADGIDNDPHADADAAAAVDDEDDDGPERLPLFGADDIPPVAV
jgi:hypothetical protein